MASLKSLVRLLAPLLLLLQALFPQPIQGHSFVTCTDQRSKATLTSVDADPSLCKGYPRRYEFRDQQADGYAFRPGSPNPPCDPAKQFRASDIVGAYSAKYPMATYKKGRDVCLQWPARNHALGYNGPYLNSGNIQVMVSAIPDRNADPTQSEFNQNLVAQVSYSDCAPDNPNLSAAENSNNRPCRGCFTVPSTVPNGIYTFQWWWEFNVGEYYSTCWDARITDTGDSFTADFAKKGTEPASSYKTAGPPPDFLNGGTRTPYRFSPLFTPNGPTTAPPPTSSPTSSPTSASTPAPTSDPTSAPPAVKPNWAMTIDGSWAGGFQASLIITSPSALTSWTLYFNLPGGAVSNLWNGDMTVVDNGYYKVTSVSWNSVVAANAKVTIGMVCTGASTIRPTNVTLVAALVANPTPAPTAAPTAAPTENPTTPSPSSPACTSALTFASKNGRLYANDQPFDLKGINWFGFENQVRAPHGCWTFDSVSACYDFMFGFLKTNQFNAVRVTLTLENIDQNPAATDFPWNGAKHLDIVSNFIDAAAAKGILIMLDLHTLYATQGIPEVWYDNTYTTAKIKQIIDTLVNRFSSKWNVFALDLKNEPHGKASWGTGDTSTDWKLAAEDLGNYALSKGVNWLIFVEGVEKNTAGYTSQYGSYWGNNLAGVKNHPIALTNNERLVYSPHVYGPSVYVMPYHPPNAQNYPSNLNAVWDDMWGFVKDQTSRAVVLGEWGGKYVENADDKKYQDQLVSYLTAKGMTSNFYWALNPNSGDTGGILQNDWRTPVTPKLNLLARLVPSPTTFSRSGSTICVANGVTTSPTSPPNSGSGSSVVDNSAPPIYSVEYFLDWENPDQKTFGGRLILTTTVAISSWALSFTFPAGQTIVQVFNCDLTSQGPPTKLSNLNYNGNVAANAKITLSIVGSFAAATVNTQPYTFDVTTSANPVPVTAASIVHEKNEDTPTSSPPPQEESAGSILPLLSLLSLISAALFSTSFAYLA